MHNSKMTLQYAGAESSRNQAGKQPQWWVTGILTLLLVLVTSVSWGQDIKTPPASHRVTDQTGTFSAGQTQEMAHQLKRIETSTGVQMAVLLVPTTGSDSIEQFANRVFSEWGIGQKGVDNGLLLVLAKNDRKVRIEVGRGLEGSLTDVAAKRILSDHVTSRLKASKGQDIYGAVAAGVNAVEQHLVIAKVKSDIPEPIKKQPAGEFDDLVLVSLVLLAVIAISLLAAWRYVESKRKEEEDAKRRAEAWRRMNEQFRDIDKPISPNQQSYASPSAVKKKPSARSVAARSRHNRMAKEVAPYRDNFPEAYTDYTSRRSSSDDSRSSFSFSSSDNSSSFSGGDSSGGGASDSW